MEITITIKDNKTRIHKAAIDAFFNGEIDIIKFYKVIIEESDYVKQLLKK